MRNDFPVLLSVCREKLPGVNLSATPAVGDDDAILQSIINFSTRTLSVPGKIIGLIV